MINIRDEKAVLDYLIRVRALLLDIQPYVRGMGWSELSKKIGTVVEEIEP